RDREHLAHKHDCDIMGLLWDLESNLPLRDRCDFSFVVDVKGYLFDESVLFLHSCFSSSSSLSCEKHTSSMAWGQNHPTVKEFILGRPKTTQLLSAIFLLIYSVTLVGNLGPMDVIHTSATLHTPMYFLLSVLSFLDICSASVFTPRLLINFLTTDQPISFVGYVVQMALMILHGTGECLLLAMMAYDQFVAICHLLVYHTIMSKRMCVQLVVVTYAVRVFISAVQTGNAFILPYCGPNIIDHYFCDIPPMLQLACSETTMANVILLVFSALVTVPTISVILVSYAYILVTICRMRSLEAQRKAFSTCASHLTALSLYYGSVFLVCVQPNPETASACNKILSVFYTIVIPILNPLVYSLKNKDVKASAQDYSFWALKGHWLLVSVMWSCKMASSFCSSVAPASLISTSATSASLPNLQLTCADIAKAEAILFHCSAYPLHFMVRRMPPLKAQSKAPSIRDFHLTVISLFNGTIVFIYAQPSSRSLKTMG
ncbi:hypothetical protein E2I00_004224, partial [Balaenoptera physalus]